MGVKGAIRFFIGCSSVVLAASMVLVIGSEQQSVLSHILLIVFINLLFSMLYIYKSRIHSPFTDIVVIFLFFFTLYAVCYPLDHVLGSLREMNDEQLLYNLRIYLFANLCLIAGMIAAAFIKKSKHTNNIQVERGRNLGNFHTGYVYFYWSGFIMLFIATCVMVYDFILLGGWNVIGLTNRLAFFQANRQFEGPPLPWRFMMTSAMVMLALGTQGKRQFYLFMGLFLSFSMFFFGGMGSRSEIITRFFPSIGILIARRYIRINRRWNLLIFIGIFLMISPLVSVTRISIREGIPLNKISDRYWAFSAGETGPSFQVTADITAENYYPKPDASYMMAVACVLPRSVYEAVFGQAKPKSLEEWYVWCLYPDIYNTGGGLGFSPVAQAWMNGQYVGILLVFMSAGFLAMWLTRGQLLQYVCLPLVILFMRSSAEAIMTQFVYNLVFIGCLLLLAAMWRQLHRGWLARRGSQKFHDLERYLAWKTNN